MTNMIRACDVLVVGGGVAGMTAAISASRSGANVLLIEKENSIGGVARSGLNSYICGLYPSLETTPSKTLNDGITREVCLNLKKLDPSKKITRIGKVYALPYAVKNLLKVFTSLLQREKGLKVLKDCHAVSVKTINKVVKEVKAKRKKESFIITPKVVIDSSGEGVIVKLSGAGYLLSDPSRCQLAGYSMRIKGIKSSSQMIEVKVPYYIRKGIKEKKLPAYLKYTTLTLIKGKDEAIIKLSVSPKHKTKEVEKDARKVHRYLTLCISSFEGTRITETSSEVLNREGIRVKGEYILKTADVLKARKFIDGVVKNAWPIEFWDQRKGPQYKYIRPGDYYEIPARCLKAKDVENLYCAGRCISASQEALASTRVMGTCMSLGEEAGQAAWKSISNEITYEYS